MTAPQPPPPHPLSKCLDPPLHCVGEAVVRALASHQSGLGWNLKADAIYGLSLLSVLVLARRGFSPDTPVFLSPQNQHFQITIQSGMHGLTSSWALSIPQKFRFEISEISRAQWNGTFRLHRPDPSHRAFGYCSCKQDTKERYWEQQFCQMERDISVRPTEMTRPVKVDHLQSWSRILPVGTNLSGPFHLIYRPKFPEFRVEWKAPP